MNTKIATEREFNNTWFRTGKDPDGNDMPEIIWGGKDGSYRKYLVKKQNEHNILIAKPISTPPNKPLEQKSTDNLLYTPDSSQSQNPLTSNPFDILLKPKPKLYIWRSMDDSKVRSSHASKDDQTFDWNSSDIKPGEDYNCRCYAEFVDGDGAEKVGRMVPYLKNGEYEPHFVTTKTPESLDKITDWYKDKYKEAKDTGKKDMIPYYGTLPPDTLDKNIQRAKDSILISTLRSLPKYGSSDYKDKYNDYSLADFGNFNYGAVAAAEGFSLDTLLIVGDADQLVQHMTLDDPRDQEMITDGFNYYNNNYGDDD